VLVLTGGALLLAGPALAGAGKLPVAGSADARYAADKVLVRYEGTGAIASVSVPAGETVEQALERLQSDPTVAVALPDYVAEAAGFNPIDPGRAGTPSGWREDQWNFVDPAAGVGAPAAWGNLGAAPGSGVTIAVLDSGVAYRAKGSSFARNPDLAKATFVAGRDLVDGDGQPLDESKTGHGTHVASTIAQATNNDLGDTGLAYGAKLMPLRVLNRNGDGRASDIAKAIRYASKHGAGVINLSLDFGPEITNCEQIPIVCRAIAVATRNGALVVGAAGNDGGTSPEMPAAAPHVLSVAASTRDGSSTCLASYSNLPAVVPAAASNWPIAAPGGGSCISGQPRSPIWQYSLKPSAAANGDFTKFGFVQRSGTSQAAAEVSAAAALVIANSAGTTPPAPRQVARRLMNCARAAAPSFGAGLLDAGRATAAGACSS
jgi:serine protease